MQTKLTTILILWHIPHAHIIIMMSHSLIQYDKCRPYSKFVKKNLVIRRPIVYLLTYGTQIGLINSSWLIVPQHYHRYNGSFLFDLTHAFWRTRFSRLLCGPQSGWHAFEYARLPWWAIQQCPKTETITVTDSCQTDMNLLPALKNYWFQTAMMFFIRPGD